jgi:hypothetical protein
MQRLLGRAAWDAFAAMRQVRAFAVAHLGDPAGAVLVIDLCRSWNYAEAGAA